MGLYGSPDLSKKYGNVEDLKEPRKKKTINRPQTNIWVWVVILLWNILFVTTIGVRFDSIFTAIISDSIIIAIISIINLIRNIIKKKDVKDDAIFLLSSIVAFFVLMQIFGAILNSM